MVDLSEQALYAQYKLEWAPSDFGDGGHADDIADDLTDSLWSVPFESEWPYNPSWNRQACDSDGTNCDRDDDGKDIYVHSCDGYPGPCSDTVHQAASGGLGWVTPTSPRDSGYTVFDPVDVGDLDDGDLTSAILLTNAGDGVVVCFDDTNDFNNAGLFGVLGQGDDTTRGGHCTEVSGVVFNAELTGALAPSPSGYYVILKNSWGCSYADGGYVAVEGEWLSDHMRSATAFATRRVGGNNAPTVQITEPVDHAHISMGGFESPTFTAVANDWEDGDDFTHNIVWTSNVDGAIGIGKTIQFDFALPGLRVITATVTDSEGAVSQAGVTVVIDNQPPVIQLVSPTPAQASQLVLGQTYAFTGQISDVNEWQSNCSNLHWTSSNPADLLPQNGCYLQLSFATVGTRTITLTGHDSLNLAATPVTLPVSVSLPALDSVPTVSILTPVVHELLAADTPTPLTSSVTSLDPILAYKWQFSTNPNAPGATWIDIGNTPNLSWTPSAQVPFHCGGLAIGLRLVVINKHGIGSTNIDVSVLYPTC